MGTDKKMYINFRVYTYIRRRILYTDVNLDLQIRLWDQRHFFVQST